MAEFDGRVAVITGGASGIGAACAALLGERGAEVAVLDRTPAQLSTARSSSAQSSTARSSTAQSSTAQSPIVLSLAVDVTRSLESAMAEVASALGGIDILVGDQEGPLWSVGGMMGSRRPGTSLRRSAGSGRRSNG